MEVAIAVFCIHMIRLGGSAFVCLYTVRKLLRISVLRTAMYTGIFVTLFCVIMAIAIMHEQVMPMFVNSIVEYFMMTVALGGGGYFLVRVADEKPAKLVFLLSMVGAFSYFCLSLSNLIYMLFPAYLSVDGPYIYADIVVDVVIYAVLLPAFIFALSKLWQRMQPLKDAPWLRLCAVSVMFILLYFASNRLMESVLISAITNGLISIFITVCALITYWQMVTLLVQSTEAAKYAERLRGTDNQLTLQAELLKEAAAHEGEIRQLRHDIRHHFAALESMLSDHENSRAMAYLREYIDWVEDTVTPSVCENAVADAICRRCIALAGQRNILTDVAVSIPGQTGVADSDLAVMFGNLWENALEACERQKQGERYIRLRSQITGNSLMISMTNSFDGKTQTRAGKDGEPVLLSLKREGLEEGIGIASIRAIVRRYQGLDEVSYDADSFHVKVLLYTKKQ